MAYIDSKGNVVGTGSIVPGGAPASTPAPAPVVSNATITKTSTPNPAPVQYNPPPTQYNPPPTSAPAPTPAPTPAPVNTSLQKSPNETIDQYNARIASQNPNLPAPGTTSSTGVTNNATSGSQSPTGTTQGLIQPSTSTSTTQTPQSSSQGTTFAGLISGLAQGSATGSPVASTAASGLINNATNSEAYNTALTSYQKAVSDLNTLKQKIAAQFSAMERGDEALPIVLGREGALQKQYAAQLDALSNVVNAASNALNAANTQQSVQQTGFTNAGNLGNTAQQIAQQGITSAATLAQPSGNFPFSYDPITGTFKNASTGASVASGLTFNPSQDAATLASAVMANQIDYNSALQALSYAGNTADGYLTTAILAKGGNPNILKANAAAQSANLGQTQVQAQQTQQAVSYANKVLDNLTENYAKLAGPQMTNIPLINTLANLSSSLSGIGLGATQAYSNALQEARAAISAALVSSGSVTPSNAGNLSLSMLPDNATPSQISSAKTELQRLLSQRQGVYTTPPNAAQYSNSGGTTSNSNSLYSW